MICKQCGAEFIEKAKGRRNTGFCCKKCADAFRYYHKKPRYEKVCEFCGKTYQTDYKAQKYCGAECSHAAHSGRTLYKKKCLYCNKEFETLYKQYKYCSPACASRHHADKIRGHYYCEYCGQERFSDHPNRHRFCSLKCARAFEHEQMVIRLNKAKEERERLLNKTCAYCGTAFKARSLGQSYCSDECAREQAKKQQREKWAEQYEPKEFICKECGKKVVTSVGNQSRCYCSKECSNKALGREYRLKRKKQMEKAYVEPVSLKIEYKLSKGICGICGLPIPNDTSPKNIWGATIDHIIPLSKGGLHQRSNCQVAHRMCNSCKGTETDEYRIDWVEKAKTEPQRWNESIEDLFRQLGQSDG